MNEIVEDILKHYGAKGMKWGVRKQKDEINSRDRVIKKGTEMQNISSKKFEAKDRHLYAAYTNYDKQAYGEMMGIFMYSEKSFKNDFKIKKDIKVPSDKVLTENFIKLAKENPKQVAKDMSRAFNDTAIFMERSPKYFERKISKVDDPLSKRGENLTKEFISSMVSDKAKQTRSEFFGGLLKQGYDAISDVNDRNPNAGTQDPLIILNPKKSIGKVKSVPLTSADLDRYWKMSFDKKHLESKDNLKEVQR